MRFDQFQSLSRQTFGDLGSEGVPSARFEEVSPEKIHPLVLAYIGDAYFNLYVRTKLLFFEQAKVRVLHGHGAKMVSATMQAKALRQLEAELTESELAVIRRGRNAKSTVPKSASIADYRISTGFEALLGFLYLSNSGDRLEQLADRAFVIISREIANSKE